MPPEERIKFLKRIKELEEEKLKKFEELKKKELEELKKKTQDIEYSISDDINESIDELANNEAKQLNPEDEEFLEILLKETSKETSFGYDSSKLPLNGNSSDAYKSQEEELRKYDSESSEKMYESENSKEEKEPKSFIDKLNEQDEKDFVYK